jgi:hypothetical protein
MARVASGRLGTAALDVLLLLLLGFLLRVRL